MGDDLLTVAEAAKKLRISDDTLYRMTRRGEIAHVRIGKAIRFSPEILQAYLAAQTVPTSASTPPAPADTPSPALLPKAATRATRWGYVPIPPVPRGALVNVKG